MEAVGPVLLQGRVGRALVGLPGVGGVLEPLPRAPRRHVALAHGAPHLELGDGHGLAAVGADKEGGPHAPVSVGAPAALERLAGAPGDLLIPLRALGVAPPVVLVGALRHLQESGDLGEGAPGAPPQLLA